MWKFTIGWTRGVQRHNAQLTTLSPTHGLKYWKKIIAFQTSSRLLRESSRLFGHNRFTSILKDFYTCLVQKGLRSSPPTNLWDSGLLTCALTCSRYYFTENGAYHNKRGKYRNVFRIGSAVPRLSNYHTKKKVQPIWRPSAAIANDISNRVRERQSWKIWKVTVTFLVYNHSIKKATQDMEWCTSLVLASQVIATGTYYVPTQLGSLQQCS